MKDSTMVTLLAGRESKAASAFLIILSSVLLLVVLAMLVQRSDLTVENDRLGRENAKLQISLDEAESRLVEVFGEPILPTDEFPGLIAMKFNELIPLDVGYARAILMMEPSFSGDLVSYQLLLENKDDSDVLPEVSVEFFDRSGEQVGVENVQLGEVTVLGAGATRSVSGKFRRLESDRTAYFRIQTGKQPLL